MTALSGSFRHRHPGRSLRRAPPLWALGVAALAAFAAVLTHEPTFLLNRTPSEPPGIYFRTPGAPRTGAIIAFSTPAAAFPYADAQMAYLRHRPLLKAIAAGPGDHVCTTSGDLVINGRTKAAIAVQDRQGRALPRWQGCRALAADELFVFSPRVANSFDSRYYGPVRRDAVLGVYRQLVFSGQEAL